MANAIDSITPVALIGGSSGGGGEGPSSITSVDIVDSTPIGRALVTTPNEVSAIATLGVDILLDQKVDLIDLGVSNGVATLDGNGKLVSAQIPDSILGGLSFQGGWDANANSPTLPTTPAASGEYWIVTVAGTFLSVDYSIGDWIVANAVSYDKVDNTDVITSVFGRSGAVTAQAGDYNTDQVTEGSNLYFTDARVRAAVLTGLSIADTNDVTALDNVLVAIGKLQGQITTGGGQGAPSNATYVTAALEGGLPNERALASGTGLVVADGGAGGSITFNLNYTELTIPGAIDNENDVVAIQSASDGQVRKVSLQSLGIGAPIPSSSDSFASVRNSVVQSIPNNAETVLDFDTEISDDDGWHDEVTNNSRLTVLLGVLQVKLRADIPVAPNATGIRRGFIKHYNSASALQGTVALDNDTAPDATYESVLKLNSPPVNVEIGDYFQVSVLQDSGAALDVNTNANYAAFNLDVVEIGNNTGIPTVLFEFDGVIATSDENQFVGSGANSLATWNSEDIDTNNWHDNTTNNSRLFVPIGVSNVVLESSTEFSPSSSGSRRTRIGHYNSSNVLMAFVGFSRERRINGSVGSTNHIRTANIAVSDGDYFAMDFLHDGSGSKTLIKDTDYAYFSARNIDALVGASGYSYAIVKHSSSQSAGELNLDTEVADTNGYHDTGVNNERLTIPSGVNQVRLSALAPNGNNSSGDRYGEIRHYNSADTLIDVVASTGEGGASSSDRTSAYMRSTVVDVTAGDYFTLFVAHGVAAQMQETYAYFMIECVEPIFADPGFSGASIRATAAQSTTSGVETTLNFNTEVYDVGDWHDNAVDNTRFTVPVGTTHVQLEAALTTTSNSSGAREGFINHYNSSDSLLATVAYSAESPGGGGSNPQSLQLKSKVIPVSAGDYFELSVLQDSGSNLQYFTNTSSNYFSIEKIQLAV